MPKLLPKTVKLPDPLSGGSVDIRGVLDYLLKLNNSLVRALDDVYSNFNYIADVGNWEDATDVAWGAFGLVPLASAPTGFEGMVAVCDGSGWDPAVDGNSYLMLYLNAGWVRVSGVT